MDSTKKRLNIGKPQFVRLFDVFVLGPVMIYTGMKRSNLPAGLKFVMAVSGFITIWYNGRNYMIQKNIDKLNEVTDKPFLVEYEE